MATLKENMEAIKLEKDTKILPENLKSGITAFGVTGNSIPAHSVEYVKENSTITSLKLNRTITLSKPYSDFIADTSPNGGATSAERWINWLNAVSDMFCSTQIQESSIYVSIVPRIDNGEDNGCMINVSYSSVDGQNYTLNEDELLMYMEMWEQEGVIGKYFNLDTDTLTFTFMEEQKLGVVGPNKDNYTDEIYYWADDFAKPFIVSEINRIDTSDANAISSDIAIGKTAYVNGKKVEGTAETGGSISTTKGLSVITDDEFETIYSDYVNNHSSTLFRNYYYHYTFRDINDYLKNILPTDNDGSASYITNKTVELGAVIDGRLGYNLWGHFYIITDADVTTTSTGNLIFTFTDGAEFTYEYESSGFYYFGSMSDGRRLYVSHNTFSSTSGEHLNNLAIAKEAMKNVNSLVIEESELL